MAISSSAIVRIRRAADGGDDTFGAFFDPGLGVAVLTRTDLVCNDSTTVTSVTGGFSGLTVNQYIHIATTTGSWRADWYLITAINSDTSISLEVKPVRGGASETGGSGTVYPGVAYNVQSSTQLSLTDIACSNTTTVTSETGGFTAAMVSNAIRITGGGATSGYYIITAQTDTKTITVDRTPGTVTNGTGKVGGAAATIARVANSSNATGDKIAAGNLIWVRGSGTVDPSSPDYDITGYIVPEAGTDVLPIRMIGMNGRPHYRGYGLLLHSVVHWRIDYMMFSASGNFSNYDGIIHGFTFALYNCRFNLNNQWMIGIKGGSHSVIHVINCEVDGGTTTPSLFEEPGNLAGITLGPGFGGVVAGCYIHHCRGHGLVTTDFNGGCFVNNIVSACAANGIVIQVDHGAPAQVMGNVIDGNKRHGILCNQRALSRSVIMNNIISNHTEATFSGISISNGTAEANTKIPFFLGMNAFFNNTTHYAGICAASSDIFCTADPYSNKAGGDFTLNNTAGGGALLRDAGLPQVFNGSNTDAYTPIGILGTPAAGGSPGARLIGQSALISG